MDVLTEQLDSSVQLPVSDATRERRDPLTLGLLPEAERRVCEAVGPGPPALAGGPPLFVRGLRHRCVPHRRGAYRARDGPRPSAEGARHCPSGHGGKGEATLLVNKSAFIVGGGSSAAFVVRDFTLYKWMVSSVYPRVRVSSRRLPG